jgi:hypothetical protein
MAFRPGDAEFENAVERAPIMIMRKQSLSQRTSVERSSLFSSENTRTLFNAQHGD